MHRIGCHSGAPLATMPVIDHVVINNSRATLINRLRRQAYSHLGGGGAQFGFPGRVTRPGARPGTGDYYGPLWVSTRWGMGGGGGKKKYKKMMLGHCVLIC